MIIQLEAFPTLIVQLRVIWFTASTTRLYFETLQIHLLEIVSLISLTKRQNEHTTYVMFGYLVLNEQPLLARLRLAGRTECIAVIGESVEQFVLCKSIWPDFTLTFRKYIPVLFGVETGSHNSRKLIWSIKDFGLLNEIAPSDFNLRYNLFS